jgi:hypothetical protein
VVAVLNWLLSHWFLIFLLSCFGVFRSVRYFFTDIAEAIGGGRHEHNTELAGTQAEAVTSPPAAGTLPAAPCRHRNVVSVRDRTDKVVAWLCKGCDTSLPADFSVYEEDL